MIYYYKIRVIIEWILIRENRLNIEYLILVDWVSRLFIRVVFLISSIIIIYRIIYINNEKYIKRFIYLVILFVVSIIIIIIRPNVLSILLGWDGLGVTSYCLVIYYQNYSSYNSGIVTILVNRIGDIGILIAIGLILIYGRWNIIFLKRSFKILIIMFILAAITKRAQIPFSVWLPIAMAAPTPVSALVHSSTLVTAGVYLIIRFNIYLIERRINIYLIFLSVLTIFIRGVIANFEFDLKKIIALSTLSQLGFIIIILRIGLVYVSFYHLLIHAIFKSILFICAGIIIHLIINNQDIRFLGNLNKRLPFTIMRFYISLMSLCGFPFIAGFYSKDLIIELIYLMKVDILIFIIIIRSLVFTVSYSIRLFYYIFFRNIKFIRFIVIKENEIINLSIIILIFNSIILGSIINWIYFYEFFIPILRLKWKLITIIICLIGIFIFIIFKLINKIKIYYLRFFFRSIWFMTYIYIYIYKPIYLFRDNMHKYDKTWLEFSKNIIFYKLIYLVKNYIINYNYKIFILIYIYIIIILLIYLIYLYYLNSLYIKFNIEDIKKIVNIFKYL